MSFRPGFWFFLTVLLLAAIHKTYCLKILQFAEGFSPSHMLFNYRLVRSLMSSSRHSVTLIAVEHFLNLSNSANEVPEGVVEHLIPSSLDEKSMTSAEESFQVMAFQEESFVSLLLAHFFTDWSQTASCDKILSSKQIMSIARDGDFDLVLAPCFDYCSLFVAHEIGAPLLWHSALSSVIEFAALSMQIPSLPSYVPNALAYSGDTMSFFQRIWNVILHWTNSLSTYILTTLQYNVYTKHFGGESSLKRPSVWELMHGVGMLLVNGEEWLEFPRPLIRGVNYLGEIGTKQKRIADVPEALDQKWEQIINAGFKGLILFSLGSVANTTRMPIEMQVN